MKTVIVSLVLLLSSCLARAGAVSLRSWGICQGETQKVSVEVCNGTDKVLRLRLVGAQSSQSGSWSWDLLWSEFPELLGPGECWVCVAKTNSLDPYDTYFASYDDVRADDPWDPSTRPRE